MLPHAPADDTHRLFADGAARGNPGPAAYGYVIEDAAGRRVAAAGATIGIATNNVAEYRGLIAGVERALALGMRRLHVRMDSELVVRQVRGEYRVRHPGLIPLHRQACTLLARLAAWDIGHVVRARNEDADRMANEALDAEVRSRSAGPSG